MNFINVKLIGNHIVCDGFHLKVPEGALKVLRDKGYEGKELIFGIRPEDVNAEPAFLETFPESVVKQLSLYQNCLVQNLTYTAKLVKMNSLLKLTLVTTCKLVQQLNLDLT